LVGNFEVDVEHQQHVNHLFGPMYADTSEALPKALSEPLSEVILFG